MNNARKIKIVIAAGGTGGHIFPALAVALEFRKSHPDASLLWIGTARSREKELCERYAIPLVMLEVTGMERRIGRGTLRAIGGFIREFLRMRSLLRQNRPDAVIAFGGYVCAPVLAVARLAAIPYFIQEQNTVPGVVNRFFAKGARHIFAGLPLAVGKGLRGKVSLTGTPVRPISRAPGDFAYPPGFDRTKKTILICGGSQGALSMNACLLQPAQRWAEAGCQVVWQTGKAAFDEVAGKTSSLKSMFVFATIGDLYPYYAVARVVVGRSGASTIAEIAYFGLPCVLIPLPWATENHQWINAGVVQTQGWGIRIKQNDAAGAAVAEAVQRILIDQNEFERMSMRALDHSPAAAAAIIVKTMMDECAP